MAVSLVASPPYYTPAYNPVFWTVTSTNTAQANFEYICDLYITGVTFAGGATYLRLKSPADPTYGYGVFPIGHILQRELTSNLGDAIFGFQQCPNSIVEYTAKFGEMYGASSGVTAYPNLYLPASQYAFNGSIGVIENKDYDVTVLKTVITAATNPNVGFLTNAPSSGTIRANPSTDDQWIYAMSQSSGAIKYANVNTYTGTQATRTLSNTFRVINHAYFNPATVANRMLRFPAGYNLNGISDSNVAYKTTATPIIKQLTTAVEIYFTDTDYNRVTASYWTLIDSPCTDYDIYRVHFKNKWGGYDSFNFTKAHQTSTEVKRNKYEKPIGTIGVGGMQYAKTNRYETNFYTENKDTIVLNSDWITEGQSTWLKELITSPEIVLDDNTNGLIPISIMDTQYTERLHITDKIFNISIKIQYTFNEIRQGA